MKKIQEKKVLVFGTFDHIHPGHIYFLNEAKKLGNLTVSVASDESVSSRKKIKPLKITRARIKDLKNLNIANEIISGDKKLGDWSILKKINPDIVAIGYDQKELEIALKDLKKKNNFKFTIKKISAKNPEKYHSSILKKKNPKLIVIFGPPAVGKFTVGKKLAEITDFKLLHNHGDIELLRPIFEFNSDSFNKLSRQIRQSVIEEAVSNNINLIFTYVWNFAIDKGKKNIGAYKKIVENAGGQVYFVELFAPLRTRIKRSKNKDREIHKPNAAKGDKIKELEMTWDMNTRENFYYPSQHLKIDNSKQEPEKTALIIKNYFKL